MRVFPGVVKFVIIFLIICSLPVSADDISSLDGTSYFGFAKVNADGEFVKKGGEYQLPVKLTVTSSYDGTLVYGMLTRAEYAFDDPEADDREFLGYRITNYGLRDCVVKSGTKFTFKLESLNGEVSKKMSAAIKSGGDVLAVKLPGADGKKVRISLRKVTDERTGIYFDPDDALQPKPAAGDSTGRIFNNFLAFMFLYLNESNSMAFFNQIIDTDDEKGPSKGNTSDLQKLDDNQYYNDDPAYAGLYTFGQNGQVGVDLTTFNNKGSQIEVIIGNSYHFGRTETKPKKKPEVVIKQVEQIDDNWRKVKFEVNNLKGLGGNVWFYVAGGPSDGVFRYVSYKVDPESGNLIVEVEVGYSNDTPQDMEYQFEVRVGGTMFFYMNFTAGDISN